MKIKPQRERGMGGIEGEWEKGKGKGEHTQRTAIKNTEQDDMETSEHDKWLGGRRTGPWRYQKEIRK